MYYIENRLQRFNTFEVKGSKDTNLLLRSVLMPWMKWSAWPAPRRSGSPERWSRTSCSPDHPPHAHARLGLDKFPVFSKNLTQKVWVCFCFCAKTSKTTFYNDQPHYNIIKNLKNSEILAISEKIQRDEKLSKYFKIFDKSLKLPY